MCIRDRAFKSYRLTDIRTDRQTDTTKIIHHTTSWVVKKHDLTKICHTGQFMTRTTHMHKLYAPFICRTVSRVLECGRSRVVIHKIEHTIVVESHFPAFGQWIFFNHIPIPATFLSLTGCSRLWLYQGVAYEHTPTKNCNSAKGLNVSLWNFPQLLASIFYSDITILWYFTNQQDWNKTVL